MTLDQLPLISWFGLGAALLIFLGPGFFTLQFVNFRRELGFGFVLTAAFGLSLGEWAVFLGFTNLLDIPISPVTAVSLFLFCWAAGLWLQKPWRHVSKDLFRVKWDRMALWAILVIGFVFSLWSIRHEVAGLGSDSYHHTLITQMIMDQGRLPQDYGSYLPIISFRYHYGFHALAAFLGWVSGIPARLLLLVLGKILVSLCAAAVALLTEIISGRRLAGLMAAVIVGVTSVLPAYMLTWGRYTQLAGLIILALFLIFFWLWLKQDFKPGGIPALAILAAGMGLTHYRIVAMAAVGALVLVLAQGLGHYRWGDWKRIAGRGFLLMLVVLGLTAPWLLHLALTSQVGFPVVAAERTDNYFSLSRFSPELKQYPTNIPLLALTALAMLSGWIRRNRVTIGLTLWFIILMLPSRYILLMDTTSVFISIFLPAAVMIGQEGMNLVDLCVRRLGRSRLQPGFAAAIILLLLLGGLGANLAYPVVNDGLLHQPDLPAMDFIRQETPADAYFMVNMFHFPFSETLIAGSDAGAWIPLLAARRVTLPVLNFYIERLSDPTWADRLGRLDQLNGDITSAAGVELLRAEGITHVYIGDRGGVLQPVQLLASPDFELIYQDQTVYIFKLRR